MSVLFVSFRLLLFGLVLWNRVLLCSSSWPSTHWIAQAGLEFGVFFPKVPVAGFIGVLYYVHLSNACLRACTYIIIQKHAKMCSSEEWDGWDGIPSMLRNLVLSLLGHWISQSLYPQTTVRQRAQESNKPQLLGPGCSRCRFSSSCCGIVKCWGNAFMEKQLDWAEMKVEREWEFPLKMDRKLRFHIYFGKTIQ